MNIRLPIIFVAALVIAVGACQYDVARADESAEQLTVAKTDISNLHQKLEAIQIAIDTLSNDFIRYTENFYMEHGTHRTPKVALPVLVDITMADADQESQIYCVKHGWTGATEIAIEGIAPSRSIVFRCERVPLAPK